MLTYSINIFDNRIFSWDALEDTKSSFGQLGKFFALSLESMHDDPAEVRETGGIIQISSL